LPKEGGGKKRGACAPLGHSLVSKSTSLLRKEGLRGRITPHSLLSTGYFPFFVVNLFLIIHKLDIIDLIYENKKKPLKLIITLASAIVAICLCAHIITFHTPRFRVTFSSDDVNISLIDSSMEVPNIMI